MNWFEVGLAGVLSAAAPEVQLVDTVTLSHEQSEILELLERGAHHLLQQGDYIPVFAW